MYQLPNLDLLMFEHSHGEDDWHRMTEVRDSSSHDPERGWDSGQRIFRCESCPEQIRIGSPDGGPDHE